MRRGTRVVRHWRDLRHAARCAQVVAGLVLLTNLALMLLTDVDVGSSYALWVLNYVGAAMTFGALTGGFWSERRRQRDRADIDRI